MRTTTFIRTTAVAAILGLLASTGSALADRDGKDGKGGGGGGGSDRSGDRSGGSARSSSGGSDRSFSRSNSSDGNKSISNSQSTFRSNRGSDDSNRNLQPPKSSQLKSEGSRDYQVRRPSDDQGRDFIKQGTNNTNINVDRFKNRSPKDRELVDREFNSWRNTWNGDKNGKGDRPNAGNNAHDNRDWSGNWKNSDRFTTADRIRSDWRNRRDRDFVFNDNWWVVNTVATTGTSGAIMAVATEIRTTGGAGPMVRDSVRGSYLVGRSRTTGTTGRANIFTAIMARST